ncbi:HAD-IA family hydrolase [Photobacterium sp. ZSDE20]|uniref:HAD-IA family hydrolase n=1 Tax=Photobacterium pectinilyticum TaxID=2906793 RepID=A0ABT1MYY1_9GAMM|nr:HAD-IA family hydrolase [Photobacterium sp. ZSDE20]MCQ1057698.1 HAD-IA family hydrolase [Photobacterium sp. ZSDE20]MDD1822091.1 HAD-IA family hydrolase [Photobacterium sp. ZSDE20]
MAMTKKAILFDLDGTLLDTAPDMADAANRVLADHNQPPLTHKQIQANTSMGAKGLLTAGFGTIPAHLDIMALREDFLRYYQDNICVNTSLYQGVVALLEQLDEKEINWGIMTNKPGFLTDMLLPFFPELLRAKTVVCGDTLAVAKPHPEPLLHASKQMGVDHRDCIYIGDIEKDMIAAKAANMAGYVAGWGYIGDEHTPSDWQALGVLTHPSEILTVVSS